MNNSTVLNVLSSTAEPQPLATSDCTLQSVVWYYYLALYLSVYLGGLLLTVSCVYLARLAKKKSDGYSDHSYFMSRFAHVQRFCEELMSGESFLGKICMFLLFVLSILSWLRFVFSTYFAASTVPYIVYCSNNGNDAISIADFSFNIYFLLVFFIRFIASRDRVMFWFSASTFVDCITIPNALYNFVQPFDFIAFNFLRSVRLINLADILMYLRLLRGYRAIRIAQLLCILIAVWLFGAGFVVVLENAGNFWVDGTPNTSFNYFISVYFILVTMSTIGYGDFTCQTVLGRCFLCIFIGIAVGMFAGIIPELAGLMTRHGPEKKVFRKYSGERHIVVCGSLSYHAMKNFLRDIFNESRMEMSRNCKVVFLLTADHVELKIKALAKQHSTTVDIFCGNPTNEKDLERVQLDSALAVLIMCNLNDPNPHEQDSTTVMRAIAIKDYCPSVRCIAQLIQYQYKVYLQNIPSWNPNVDGAVCITELKLALIAQNCIAPGFCTLLTNLITFAATKSRYKKNSWQDIYKFGADYEIYHVGFSDTFTNLLFNEAVELCFTRLDVMLIAIDIMDSETKTTTEIIINPYDTVHIDPSRMCAFVIAKSESEAKRLFYYCLSCHTHRDARNITKCDCNNYQRAKSMTTTKTHSPGGVSTNANAAISAANRDRLAKLAAESQKGGKQQSKCNDNSSEVLTDKALNRRRGGFMQFDNSGFDSESKTADKSQKENHQAACSSASEYDTEPSKAYVDSTGLFHWCPRRRIEEVLLDSTKMKEMAFTGHVIACVFVQPDTPTLGLVNFVMPLRSIFLAKSELKPIVFIGNYEYFEREWPMLQNFPLIYILPGSPLNRANLRAAYLSDCSSCVIVSSPHVANAQADDQSWIDNEAVICTLTIKSMPNSGRVVGDDEFLKHDVIGENINIFTELINEKNGVFLDVNDRYEAGQEVFMLQGFASGRLFNVSILHSLMSNTFFSADTLRFVQALICGGITADLEHILAEENGLPSGKLARNQSEYFRSTFRLKQMSLRQPPLSECLYETKNESAPIYFRQVFLKALRHYGIICLGIYRKMAFTDAHDGCKRFVITFPPREFVVDLSDQVFCIEPVKNEDLPNIPLNSDDSGGARTELTRDYSTNSHCVSVHLEDEEGHCKASNTDHDQV